MTAFSRLAVTLTVLSHLMGPGLASAKPQWVGDFAGEYPSATRLHSCGICHTNFSSNSSRNDYGNAWKNADGKKDPVAGFRAIEGDDSDGDGTSNLDEILLLTGFMPGYDCDNYLNTSNAPADLADFVDPMNIGCGSTTTSSTVTSTTSLTTSTTLPATACAQPLSTGATPTASDCLFILNAAVSAVTCTPECVCAPKGSLPISATDALMCLNKATGLDVPLNCPC